MPSVNIEWWKATEIPLAEADWKNIRLYSDTQQSTDPFGWDRCVYCIRLSPPFAVHYGDDKKLLISPLIYVGSGALRSRWSGHRKWLSELGYNIPGGRYEVWVCKPRVRNNDAAYLALEGHVLTEFKQKSGFLPLRNRRIEAPNQNHEYDIGLFDDITESDRRYLWAIWPQERSAFYGHYYKGSTDY